MADERKLFTATNDYIFKAMMVRNVDLLQDFLSAVFPKLAAECREITYTNPDLLPYDKDKKRATLDVKLVTANQNVIDIEVQVDNKPGLSRRMLFYIGKIYGDELARGSAYTALNRAISLWICKFNFFDDDACMHSFAYYDSEHGIPFPDSPEIVILEIPKFAQAHPHLNLWLKFLDASTEEEFMALAQQTPVMNKAWNVIASLNADDRERAIADAYDRARWDEFFTREGAFKEGKAEGKAEGRVSEREETARAMLAAGEPRAKILQFSRLTEEELDKLM